MLQALANDGTMIAYYAKNFETEQARAHPWSVSQTNENHRYVDFKKEPELIRSSIEDLEDYKGQGFCESFYSLIEWINGSSTFIESNDCAFRGARKNPDTQFSYANRCDGRLQILYRDIHENCNPDSITWLIDEFISVAKGLKPKFTAGAVGVTRMPTIYKALSPEPNKGGLGEQVMFSFFAYGKNSRRCYESMENVIQCTRAALSKINKRIENGALAAING